MDVVVIVDLLAVHLHKCDTEFSMYPCMVCSNGVLRSDPAFYRVHQLSENQMLLVQVKYGFGLNSWWRCGWSREFPFGHLSMVVGWTPTHDKRVFFTAVLTSHDTSR